MNTLPRLIAIGAAATALLLAACAAPPAPFVYRPSNDIKPGPGLFSGADGVLTIYGAPETDEDNRNPFQTMGPLKP
jgi:hypothetical protein